MFKFEDDIIEEFNPYLERLQSKKDKLVAIKPFSDSMLSRLQEDLALEWTHHSTSIAGNTLSLNETALVIQKGLTISGKSLREHFEVFNHNKAILFLKELIVKPYELSASDILSIHAIALSNIEDDLAGKLRVKRALLEGLITYIVMNPHNYSPLLLATYFHYEFVKLHPFEDANGRTVRLILNLILMQSGYPPAIILRQDRKKYFRALHQANTGNYKKLLLIMLQATERSLNINMNALPDQDEYLPISLLLEEEQLPYGQEYISLLARSGKIDAYKEGRNWLTTKAAVESYHSAHQ